MNPALATREIYWNIRSAWLIYLLLVPTALIAAYGFYRRFRLWRCGRPGVRWDRPGRRFGLLLRHAVAQGRTLREAIPGSFHLLIWAGFIVLTAATLVVMLDADFHTAIMRGRFYLWFQSLAADLFGGLLIAAPAVDLHGRGYLDSGPAAGHRGHRLPGGRLANCGHRGSLGRLVAGGKPGCPGGEPAFPCSRTRSGASHAVVVSPGSCFRFSGLGALYEARPRADGSPEHLHGQPGRLRPRAQAHRL